MKTIAIMLGSLIAFSGIGAALDGPVRTVRSSTDQFVVRGPTIAQVRTNSPSSESALIELDPSILAVSCERLKQALLRELGLVDFWRGRIYLEISPALSTNQAPIIVAKPFLDGWQYQMELPRWIEKPKLVRGLIQLLLMEIANRSAGLRSAEIPLWLSEGLSQHLVHSSEVDLVLAQPQWNFNRVNISWQARQSVRQDPLKEVRERLQSHAALTFAKLGDALPDPVPEETWKTFQASAQLFVSRLLLLPGGRATLAEMLNELPFYLNWQSAFLNAYRAQFPRLLDAEKWWAVVLVQFTGQDPTQAWSTPVALEKLNETLHPSVLVSATRKDLPQRARPGIQQIISDWEYLRQRIVLKGVTSQLLVVRFKTPPELTSLVDDYRATIENYLNKRDQVGLARSLPGLPPTRADLLVRDAAKKLNELDQKRASISATNAPPANTLARPAK
ncbi:MAG: hypothetical protein DME21_03965 [Verrucomicrobia bacterium]|nr:MAG: hypothetical protein DME21_03965 [Verrucomicrobiota bacterium]